MGGYRYLFAQLVRRELRRKYKGSTLGVLCSALPEENSRRTPCASLSAASVTAGSSTTAASAPTTTSESAAGPLLYTTYAHAVYGLRADYSLSLRYVTGPGGAVHDAPRPLLAVGPPLRNHRFALWRIRWPARPRRFPDASSQALVEL